MNLLWPMDPQYQSRDDLHTTTQILADESTLANEPPCYQSRDDLHTTTQNLADEPVLANGPPFVPEQRWLAYHYKKHGRWTYFGQWTPSPCYQRRDDLHTTTQNLADEPTLADGPPSTREEMTCIPLHKTWQMSLLWPMDPLPLLPEKRWLAHHYTKLGRWTYFGWWTPSTRAEMTCIPLHKTWQMSLLWPMDPLPLLPEKRWLAYHYTKLGRWTYFGWWTPQYQSRDDLHTTTQNLADEPTLAEHNGKGLKALAFTISEIPHRIFSNHLFP